MGVRQPRGADPLRRGAPDPDLQGQARREPVLDRRQPPAQLVRGQGARGPLGRSAEYVHQRTISPEDAPDKATVIEIGFEGGDPVTVDGEILSPAALLTRLNQLGH
jgi:hypothetical protein